ncbi:DNA recombination and repair protein RecO [Anaerovibrio sp. JC8]|uniref:DNA repair protein RecO n=1 Tax=Anaerovibrio sp. JC8 TaxID=1240085 RepID=UPI000A0AC491|nr:DNA repair protein RecO [Anaerovibrio sp. JC8]ORT99448.1 DNA recombination and repair protein RecO [Anaerovibrio sp. JC8]
MAQYQTEALVLGVKNWGEADKIITLLSREHGKITATAFGCRRPKSPLAGPLQMFNEVDIQLTKGNRLDTVRQASLKQANKNMSTDFSAMAYGAFVAELATNLSVEGFPQADMYDKLLEVFAAFGSRNPRIAALAAAFQILEFSGMQLSYERCIRSNLEIEGDAYFSINDGGAISPALVQSEDKGLMEYPEALRVFIGQLLQLDWLEKPAFKVNGRIMVQAESLLLGYLYHIFGKPMKSLQFIQQVG